MSSVLGGGPNGTDRSGLSCSTILVSGQASRSASSALVRVPGNSVAGYRARVEITVPERTLSIRRAAMRLCGQLAWAGLREFPLPNGRRADILALRPDGGFACIEVKSGVRDFLADSKWPEYRDFCDALYFAVDADFPHPMIPQDVGLIVVSNEGCAELLRNAALHALSPARRRALLHRFATLGAVRLSALEDPAGRSELRAALRAE